METPDAPNTDPKDVELIDETYIKRKKRIGKETGKHIKKETGKEKET
jgi:hypothetical protein